MLSKTKNPVHYIQNKYNKALKVRKKADRQQRSMGPKKQQHGEFPRFLFCTYSPDTDLKNSQNIITKQPTKALKDQGRGSLARQEHFRYFLYTFLRPQRKM